MLVAQTSPPAALGAAFVPTVSPVAGMIGIGTRTPPLNPPPSAPPTGLFLVSVDYDATL